jgi:hypothetical protein
MKLFSDYNGETVELQSWDLMNRSEFAIKFPGVKGKNYDSFDKFVGKHPVTGEIIPITRRINYAKKPSLHKCDARCLNAKGNNCECSCGGKNHGRGFNCD